MRGVIPVELQGVLWSRAVESLDLRRDKAYIIHQIFSHGRMEEIEWLFEVYGREELRAVFLQSPYKDYDGVRFHFVKNYLLELKGGVNERRYVKNTPRDIE